MYKHEQLHLVEQALEQLVIDQQVMGNPLQLVDYPNHDVYDDEYMWQIKGEEDYSGPLIDVIDTLRAKSIDIEIMSLDRYEHNTILFWRP